MFFFLTCMWHFLFPEKIRASWRDSRPHMCLENREKPCVLTSFATFQLQMLSVSANKSSLDGSQAPQQWNLKLAHVSLHMKDSSLWKGLLTGENKLLSFCGSLFNIQDRGSSGSTGRSGSHLFFAQQLWCVETQHIRNWEQWRRFPVVLQPSLTRAGKEWEAMWNEELAASLSQKTILNNQGEKISIFWEEQLLKMSLSKIIVLYYIF